MTGMDWNRTQWNKLEAGLHQHDENCYPEVMQPLSVSDTHY